MTTPSSSSGRGPLTVARREISFDDARVVVAGYCFGTRTATWKKPSSGVGEKLSTRERGAFAYRTYDCVPAAESGRLEPIDVLVADGLNAEMRARDIAGVLAVADAVGDELARIDPDVTFWTLSKPEVSVPPIKHDERSWPIWRAWTILVGVKGINVARAHKILHHKRPTVFPLLDNQTVGLLDSKSPWGAIHEDLTATAPAWSTLESEAANFLASQGGPPLTRLRLHDILLWTRATNNWAEAHRRGKAALK